jgi:uncharacterized protein YbcI
MKEGAQKTRGQLEAAVSDAVIRFEKEYMGRGPLEAKTYIFDDLVLVRLQGVLTPAEIKLAEESSAEQSDRHLVKQLRQALIERGRPLLERDLEAILGVPARSLHTDISVRTGERIIVFSMERMVPFRRTPGPDGDGTT